MISKQQFIDNMIAEVKIIRHLGTKITPEMLDYRPHEKQRTMLELMSYLGHAFSTGVTVYTEGNGNLFMELATKAPKVTLENFDEVMKNQTEEVRAKLDTLTEENMKNEVEVWGRNATVAEHLFGVMKWVVAYKMQLFLYIKACGNHDINTSNLWRGTDPAPKA